MTANNLHSDEEYASWVQAGKPKKPGTAKGPLRLTPEDIPLDKKEAQLKPEVARSVQGQAKLAAMERAKTAAAPAWRKVETQNLLAARFRRLAQDFEERAEKAVQAKDKDGVELYRGKAAAAMQQALEAAEVAERLTKQARQIEQRAEHATQEVEQRGGVQAEHPGDGEGGASGEAGRGGQLPGEAPVGGAQGGEAKEEVGRPAVPTGVHRVSVKDLHIDPERFQYKLNVGEGGVGQELKGGVQFDPELSGVVSVWRDPANGKDYVVNGHHRYELAERSGHPDIDVKFISAENPKEARAKGALQNIAEGRGTAVDAAKFMRDLGFTPADLSSKNISLRGKIAADAAALVDLNDRLFHKVSVGHMEPEQAVAIASKLKNHKCRTCWQENWTKYLTKPASRCILESSARWRTGWRRKFRKRRWAAHRRRRRPCLARKRGDGTSSWSALT